MADLHARRYAFCIVGLHGGLEQSGPLLWVSAIADLHARCYAFGIAGLHGILEQSGRILQV